MLFKSNISSMVNVYMHMVKIYENDLIHTVKPINAAPKLQPL